MGAMFQVEDTEYVGEYPQKDLACDVVRKESEEIHCPAIMQNTVYFISLNPGNNSI